ncbi:hypothetical protein LBMAG46_09570 [Planctomycetia bacterium]|nr:hypothetical protein LBMAG46_09570 [Planctomycetia bacterium]
MSSKFFRLIVLAATLLAAEAPKVARADFNAMHVMIRGAGQLGVMFQRTRGRRTTTRPAGVPAADATPVPSQQDAPGGNQPAITSPSGGPRRLAVVVTVQSPTDELWQELPGVAATGDKLVRNLIQGGYAVQNIVHLSTAADAPGRMPTAEAIRSDVKRICQLAEKDDRLLICLIGHGFGGEVPAAAGKPKEKRSWFVAADTPHRVRGEVAKADSAAVSIQSIVSLMADSRAEQKVLMVDACQDVKGQNAPVDISIPLASRGNVWVLTSCSPGQTALVDVMEETGEVAPVFSSHFADSLNWKRGFDDDGDGIITVREAWRHAYGRTVSRQQQNPVCMVGSGIVPLVELPVQIPEVGIVSGDPEEEQRLAAAALCNGGQRLMEREYARVSAATVEALKSSQVLEESFYKDYQLVAGYVLSNHVPQAREFTVDTREECLLKGRHLRSIGSYPGALQQFRQAGESLIVFANGSLPDAEIFYGNEAAQWQMNQVQGANAEDLAKQAAPGVDVETILKNLSSVPAYSEPSTFGTEVRQIQASTALTIRSTEQRDGNVWLQIQRVENDDRDLTEPLWIQARDVHWFKEAAQMFLPGSDLDKKLSSVMGSHQRNASLFWMSQGRLQRLREAIVRIQRAQRAIAIARTVGAPIPGQVGGALGIVQSALQIAESAVMKNQRRSYQQYTAETTLLDFEQMKYLQSSFRELDGDVVNSRVRLQSSPWLPDSSGE